MSKTPRPSTQPATMVRTGKSILAVALMSTAIGLFIPRPRALALDWDVNGGNAGTGGTGVWSSLTAPWFDSASGLFCQWPGSYLDTAVFGGTAGTVSVAGTVKAGTIQFDTTGYTLGGNGTVNLGGAAAVQLNVATATINTVLSGSALTLNSSAPANVLTLTGANTYTGPTAINSGILSISSAGNLGDNSATNVITLNGGTLRTTATMDLGVNRDTTVSAASIIEVTAGTTTLSGDLSGSGALAKNGSGVLVLSGNNTAYTGAVTVTSAASGSGVLRLASSSALTNATGITLAASGGAGGTGTSLDIVGGQTISGPQIVLNSNLASNLRTAIQAGGAAGETNTLGNNIQINGDNFNQLYANNGTFIVNGNISAGSGIASSTLFLLRGGASGVINGTINIGGATLSKTDGGTWTINSTGNTMAAASVSVGTVKIGISDALTTTVPLTLGQNDANGAIFDLNGFNQTVASLASNPTTAGANTTGKFVTNSSATQSTFTVNGSTSTTYAGQISGNLQLVKSGSGTLTLAGGTSNFAPSTSPSTQAIMITGGTLAASADAQLGAATNGITIDGGTLSNPATSTLGMTRTITIGSGGATFDTVVAGSAGKILLSGMNQLVGSASITKTGPGTVQMNQPNMLLSSNWTQNAGIIEVQNNFSLGSGTVTVNGGEVVASGTRVGNAMTMGTAGMLSFNNPGVFSGSVGAGANNFSVGLRAFQNTATGVSGGLGGQITGSGIMTLVGPSTAGLNVLALGGDSTSTFTGSVVVGANTGLLMGPNSLPLGTAITVQSGGYAGFGDDGSGTGAPQSLTASIPSAITWQAGSVGYVIGRVGTTANYNLAANKTLVTPSLANHTAGKLVLVPLNGYGLEINGATSVATAQTYDVGGTQASNVVPGLTISGLISGGGGITKIGTGTLLLTNSSNSFTGNISATAGVIAASNDGALGDPANTVTLNGTTTAFRATGSFSTSRTISLGNATAANNIIEVQGADPRAGTTSKTLVLNTALGGAVANGFVKNENGTLALNYSDTTRTGTITVNAGALRIDNQAALGTTGGTTSNANAVGSAIQLNGGAAGLTMAEPFNITGSGINTGGALQSLAGAGTNTLSGSITLGGAATIGVDSGSTLAFSGTWAGAQPLTLAGAGTGTISNVLGTITGLTKIGSGTWNLTGANTFTGTATAQAGTLTLSGANGRLAGNPTIALQYGAALTSDNFAANPTTANRFGTSGITTTGGGTLLFSGLNNGTTNEATGAVAFGRGTTIVTAQPNGTGQMNLTLGTVTRPILGSVLFRGAGLGSAAGAGVGTITSTAWPAFTGAGGAGGLAKGILPYALVDATNTGSGTSFATADNATSRIRPLAGTEYSTTFTAGTFGNNINLGAAATTADDVSAFAVTPGLGASAAMDINSLTLASGGSLTIDAAPRNVRIGGGAAGNFGGILALGGNGGLSGGVVGAGLGELIIHTPDAATVLDVNSTLVGGNAGGAAALTKAGDGRLDVSLPAFTSGQLSINQGEVKLNSGSTNTFRLQNFTSIHKTGTLNLNGTSQLVTDLFSDAVVADGGGTVTSASGGLIVLNRDNSGRNWAGRIRGTTGLIRAGQNTWTLYSDNDYSGVTYLQGGTTTLRDAAALSGTSGLNINYGLLTLDNNAGTLDMGDRVRDAATVDLRGGNIVFQGRAQAASTETMNTLNLAQGWNTVGVAAGGTGVNSADLIFSSLTRTAGSGATIGFSNAAGGQTVSGLIGSNARIHFTTAPTLTNDILPYGVVLRDWASYVPGLGVGALNATGYAGYSPNTILNATSTDNIKINNVAYTLAANTTVNSLNWLFSANQNLNLGGNTLTIGSGGLMITTGTNTVTATLSNGNITSGAPNVGGDLNLFFLPYGGTARLGVISANITDNGTGPVRLVASSSEASNSGLTMTLSGANNYSGGTVINGGTVAVGATGTIPAGGITLNGGTLSHGVGGVINSTNIVTLKGPSNLTYAANSNNSLAGLVFDNNGGTAGATVTTGGVLTLPTGTSITATSSNVGQTPAVAGRLSFGGNTTTFDVAGIKIGSTNIAPWNSTLNIAAAIDNAGLITKSGDGILQLSGQSSWTGGMSVTGGGLAIAASSIQTTAASNVLATTIASGPLGTGTLTMASGTSLLSNGSTIFNPVVLSGDLDFNGTGNLTLNGATTLAASSTITTANPATTLTLGQISGTGRTINKAGPGTLNFGNGSSLDSTSVINVGNGTVALTTPTFGDVRTPAGAAALNLNGGLISLRSSGSNTFGNNVAVNAALNHANLEVSAGSANGTTAGLGDAVITMGDLSIAATQQLNLWNGGAGGLVKFGTTSLTGAGSAATLNPASGTGFILPGGFSDTTRPVNSGTGVVLYSGNNTFTTGLTFTDAKSGAAPAANTSTTPYGAGNTITLGAGGTFTITPTGSTSLNTTGYTSGGLLSRFYGYSGAVTGMQTAGAVGIAPAATTVTRLGDSTFRTGPPLVFGPQGTTNVGVVASGLLNIGMGGTYNFAGGSDDQLEVNIDGQSVILDQGAGHALDQRLGSIYLAAGQHTIIVRAFNGGGGGGYQLWYAGPDTTANGITGAVPNMQPIPASALSYVSSTPTAGNGYLNAGLVGQDFAVTAGATGTVDMAGSQLDAGISSLTLGNGSTFALNNANGVGNLLVAGTTTLGTTGTISPGSGTLNLLGGINDGGNGLTKAGAGTLVLGASTNFTGAFAVNAGFVQLQSPTALTTSATGTTIANTAVLDLNGQSGVTGVITIAGTGPATKFSNAPGSLYNSSGDAASLDSTASLKLGVTGTTSATISGYGDIAINGVISDGVAASTLVKAGPNTLTLSGNNTYTGVTTIGQGVLKAGHANALGTAAGNTSIATGATLDLNGTALNEPLSINGAGFSGLAASNSLAALINSGAAVTLPATTTIALATAASIGSNSLAPGGDITIGGVISGSLVLTKVGGNTVTLTANNTLTGQLQINLGTVVVTGAAGKLAGNPAANTGATLILDNSGGNLDNRLSGRGIFTNGTVRVIGNSAAPTNELISVSGNNLNFLNSGSVVSLEPHAAQPLVMNITSNTAFARTAGATTVFRGNNLGVNAAATPGNGNASFNLGSQANPGFVGQTGAAGATNRAIIPWALVDNLTTTSFAAHTTTNGLQVLGASDYSTTLTGVNIPNVDLAAAATAASGATLINSLTLRTGGSVAIGAADRVQLDSGGILATDDSAISGTGQLVTTANREFIIHTAGATTDLTLGSTIIGTGGLTKGGNGNLILGATNNAYTGATTINGGKVTLAADNAIFIPVTTPQNVTASAGFSANLTPTQNLVMNLGGTLDLAGYDQVVANLTSISTLPGNAGTITNSLTGAPNTSNFRVGISNSNYSTAVAFQGNLNLIRGGAWEWSLTSPNTHTGTTLLDGGATVLIDKGTFQSTSEVTVRRSGLTWRDTGIEANANRLGTAPLKLNGGSLFYDGRAGGSTANVNSVVLVDGPNLLGVRANNGPAELVIGSLSRTANTAGITFMTGTPTAGGVAAVAGSLGEAQRIMITSAPSLTNGIIGAWATVADFDGVVGGSATGQLRFATYDAVNGVRGLTGPQYNNTWGAANNYRVGSGTNAVTAPGSVSLNTLSFVGGAAQSFSFSSATDTLTLTAGGIVTGIDSQTRTIGTAALPGQITTGAGVQQLFLHSGANTLTVNSAIIDNGSAVDVVVSGAGLLTNNPTVAFNGANAYTGTTYVNGAILNLNRTGGVAVPGNIALSQGTLTGGDSLSVANTAVVLFQANQINPAATVTFNGGTLLNLNGQNQTLGGLTFNNDGGTRDFASGRVLTGAGTLTLNGNISVPTPTNTWAIPTLDGNLNLGGATRTVSVDPLALSPLQVGLAINSVLTNGGITKTGNGVLSFGNTSPAFTGGVSVNAGTVTWSTGGAVMAATPFTVDAAAKIDMRGLNATIGSLAGAGTVTNESTTAATLTLGGDNTSPVFTGAIINPGPGGLVNALTSGALTLTKVGTGNFALSNAGNTYSGGTNVNAGILTLAGSTPATSVAGTGLVTVNSGATLTGTGGATGGLQFNPGSIASLIPAAAAPVTTSAVTALGGTINLGGGVLAAGTYQLIDYTGTAPTVAQFAGLKLGTTPGGSLLYGLVNNTAGTSVDLTVEAAGASNTWTGFADGAWSVGNATNFSTTYADGQQVTFNDTGINKGIISGGSVAPQAMLFTNSLCNDYSISNVITGAMAGGLVKNGAGTVQLTGNNTFTGATTVNGGTLRANVATGSNSLGSSAITLASGATLQFDPTASTANAGLNGRTFVGGPGVTSSMNPTGVAADSSAYFATGGFVGLNGTATGNYASGVPTLPTGLNFSQEFLGKIKVTSGGYYNFGVNTDDGVRVYVDGVLTTSWDNGHGGGGPLNGNTIYLAPGLHEIRELYFQGTGGAANTVTYSGPDTAGVSTTIPSTVLFRPETEGLAGSSNAIIAGNSVSYSGSSTLALNGTGFTAVQLGLLNPAAGSTLNVATTAGKVLRAQATLLPAAGSYVFNSTGNVNLGQVRDGGNALTIIKQGTGRMIFDNTNTVLSGLSTSLTSSSTIDVQGGKIVVQGIAAGGTNPLGSAAVRLSGGGMVLDTKNGGVTYNNAISLTSGATIENIVNGTNTILSGSVSMGTSNLTVDSMGGARNGAGINTINATGATTQIDGIISGSGSLTLRSTQYSLGANFLPVNGGFLLQGANTLTGTVNVIGEPVFTQGLTSGGPVATTGGQANLTLKNSGTILNAAVAGLNLVNGQLTIDNTGTINTNRIADTQVINLSQSVLQFTANTGTGAVSTETVGAINLVNGFNKYNHTNVTTGSTTLTAASLGRSNGSTLYLQGSALGGTATSAGRIIFTAVPTLTGGAGAAASTTMSILPYAVASSQTAVPIQYGLVTNDTNGLRPLAAAEYTTSSASAVATNNVRDTVAGVAGTLTGAKTFNALVLDNSSAAANATYTLTGTDTITSGQVVFTNTTSSTTASFATNLTGGDAASRLAFGAAEANLFVMGTGGTTISAFNAASPFISGSGGLTVSGLGMLTLVGDNSTTLTGTTTVNGTTLNINADVNLGAATNAIRFGGGTIRFNATGITLASGRTVTLPANSFGAFDTGAFSGTIAGQVTGAGDLVKFAGNTLNLTNATNNYTGRTLIYSGTVAGTTATVPGSSVVNHGSLAFSQGTDGTFAGAISGSGSLSLTNSNAATTPAITYTLTGANTFSGLTTLATSGITLKGSTTSLPGTIATGAFTANRVNFDQTTNGSSNALVTGSGSVLKTGTGVVTLTNASTYTGTTTISAGGLIAGANAPVSANGVFGNAASAIVLGDAATTTNNSAVSLQAAGGVTVARAITVANQATTGGYSIGGSDSKGTATFSGALTLNQNATITQAGDCVDNGNLTVLSGGISSANGARTLTFAGPGNMAVTTNPVTNGTGTVAVTTTGGRTTISAASNYTGGTIINGGILANGVNNALPTTAGITVNGGVYDTSGFNQSLTGLTGYGAVTNTSSTSNSTLTLTNSSTATFSGTISNNSPNTVTPATLSVVMNGSSTQTLTGLNKYDGSTTISQGTLEIGGAGAIRDTSAVSISGGTLLLSGTNADRVNNAASVSIGGASTASKLVTSGSVTESFGALTLTTGSGVRVIDMGSTASVLTFASLASSATGVAVQIWNWSGTTQTGGGLDQLLITPGSLGANIALTDITFYSDGGSTAYTLPTGWTGTGGNELAPIPEAGGVLTALLLLGSAGWRERRKLLRVRSQS